MDKEVSRVLPFWSTSQTLRCLNIFSASHPSKCSATRPFPRGSQPRAAWAKCQCPRAETRQALAATRPETLTCRSGAVLTLALATSGDRMRLTQFCNSSLYVVGSPRASKGSRL